MADSTPTVVEQSAPAASHSGVGGSTAPIVFFDGVCGLCNRAIDFVIRHDRGRAIHFAPLQGETARQRLPVSDIDTLSSFVFSDHSGVHRRSDAVWRLLTQMGGIWRFCGWMLRLVPRPMRNVGYNLIARNRYRWFGRKESCRLPTPAERERFLP